jgi:hypothetical protein
MAMRWIAALFAVIVGSSPMAAAGRQCSFALRPFSEGAVTCQGGHQFRCMDGTWQAIGTTCAEAGSEAGMEVHPGVNVPVVRQPSVDQPAPPHVDRPDAP